MMKRSILFLTFLLIIFVPGCRRQNRPDSDRDLNRRQTELVDSYRLADSIYYKEGRIDTAAFGQFIRKALDYTARNPKDKVSPDMLYRAGIGSMILAKATQDPAERATHAKTALNIFHRFQDTYPDHEQVRMCFYQRGIVYDDILGDTRSAEDEFRDFINRYPDDSLAVQLQQYLKIMGMSEAEIEKALNIQ